MPMEVFTKEWSRACCERLNRSEEFRAAAADWEEPVVLVMERDPALGVEEDRAFHLELHRGSCRGVRRATAADLEEAGYVMRATPAVWRHVLERELDPVAAVLQGKLRLARGNAFALARHAGAARALVAVVAEVEGAFPPPRI